MTKSFLMSTCFCLSFSFFCFGQQKNDYLIRQLEEQQREAIFKSDTVQLYKLLSKKIVVQNPENRIIGFDEMFLRIREGKINYAVFERRIDHISFMNKVAIVMGQETVQPQGNTKNAGKIVKYRFTNIWSKEKGLWKLSARQATIISLN